jgi:hypothetical protein|tara:strand:- start:29 stop:835 length:807 start_codon:yes stop_codon:yes gene_type:complete
MAQTKAVAKATKLDLAVLAGDSKEASGFGNLDISRDVAIPYINIIQTTSPQLNPSKAEFVEGAKVGQFYNTVTQEVSESLNVISVLYQLRYVEWKPRESGGGLVEMHNADSGILGKTTRDKITFKDTLSNGNYIATTAYHYVMVQGTDGNWSQAVISMTSTQLKKSRRWNSLMLTQKVEGPSGSFTPPTYAIIYKLTTVSESNDRGSWFGYQVEKVGMVEDVSVYNDAKSFSTAASRGDVEAKPVLEGEPAKVAPQSNKTVTDEDLPF